jgi:hypothetical protein
MAVRTLTPANYRFASAQVWAVQVRGSMLEDHVIDFARLAPDQRSVVDNDLLQPNDVVLGFTGREATSVGIYHSAFPSPEPVTLAPFTLAFRALNLAEATAILAGLIYRLQRRPGLELSEIRTMPIILLTDEQVVKFLELIKTTHEMWEKARKREKLMRELIPATIHKFFDDNAA